MGADTSPNGGGGQHPSMDRLVVRLGTHKDPETRTDQNVPANWKLCLELRQGARSSPTSSSMVIERYTQAARTLMDNITAAGVQTSRSSPSVTHRNHIYRSIIKRNTRRTHRVATRSWSHKGNHHPLVETSPESTPPGSQLPGQAWAGQAESRCQRNGETGQLRTSDLQSDQTHLKQHTGTPPRPTPPTEIAQAAQARHMTQSTRRHLAGPKQVTDESAVRHTANRETPECHRTPTQAHGSIRRAWPASTRQGERSTQG